MLTPRLILALTLVTATAAPAVAAAQKPSISITTRSAEITVGIADALNGYPGLTASCLAEGRRWAEKMRRDAAKELRQIPQMFPKGRPWHFEREYTSRSVVGRYVSVLRSDYSFTNGAHPNTTVDTIVWDSVAQKRVNIRPFFNDAADNGPTMTALATLVRAAVVAAKKARGVDIDSETNKQLDDAIKPQLARLGSVSLAPSTVADKSAGITFHFSPYAVGPYAEGGYAVFVPWTTFKAYLSPAGAAIFGGERPAGDEKKS